MSRKGEKKEGHNLLRKFYGPMFKHILSLFLKVSGAVMHTLILYEMGVINVLKIMLLLNDRTKI